MADISSIPVHMTLLGDGLLVEVNPAGPLGALTFVPLTPEQVDTLRDACPDDSDDDWRIPTEAP